MIFSTACSIEYKYCTRPIRRHLYSGIFKDPLDRGNTKSLKIDNIHKFYVLCLKLDYFLKSCTTLPLNATSGREMSVKNITWNRSMACLDTIGLAVQPIQVECMSSLCNLCFKQRLIYIVSYFLSIKQIKQLQQNLIFSSLYLCNHFW